jgi:hypothetical protein
MKPRCICGRSAQYPLCDGSHTDEEWACAAEPRAAVVVVSAPPLVNLARRLAARLRGVSLTVGDPPIRGARVVVLTDGLDLEHVATLAAQVQATDTRVLALGAPAALVGPALGGRVTELADGAGPGLWRRVIAALETPGEPVVAQGRRWFISHATADEVALEPVAAYLREELGLDVFLCSDSLAPGGRWQRQLQNALEAADAVLFVLSAASAGSVFCAWELGWAMGHGTPVRVVRLDGAAPPAPIQHLHLSDVGRLAKSRPWLEADEVRVLAVLQAMADEPTAAAAPEPGSTSTTTV